MEEEPVLTVGLNQLHLQETGEVISEEQFDFFYFFALKAFLAEIQLSAKYSSLRVFIRTFSLRKKRH